jgi:hypothetical protein
MSTFFGAGTPWATRMVRFAPRAASSKLTTTCARMLVRRRRCSRKQEQSYQVEGSPPELQPGPVCLHVHQRVCFGFRNGCWCMFSLISLISLISQKQATAVAGV